MAILYILIGLVIVFIIAGLLALIVITLLEIIEYLSNDSLGCIIIILFLIALYFFMRAFIPFLNGG